MIDAFNYSDFRKFLADRLRELKARHPKFSHRYVSKEMGYGSAGFFADIIAGRKNLTGTQALSIAHIMELSNEEKEYFLNLVLYNQAPTLDEKNRYYEKMMGITRIAVKVLETEKFEYFSHWYNAAIRELLSFYPFSGDYQALAEKLVPPISVADAIKAVNTLIKCGMVRQEVDGSFRLTDVLVSTGVGFAGLNIANYQRAFLDMAREGLDRHPPQDRDYSTLCLPLADEDLIRARSAIAKLRNYLLALSENCANPSRVYHFNFQAFPITRN